MEPTERNPSWQIDPATREPSAIDQDAELDPVDRAWQRSRYAGGSLVFGAIGILASPILLGLVLGPIGMRMGLDLWRSGTRRALVAAGIAASLAATALSMAAALAWGSLLSSILLGRDAMRETERWRGRQLDSALIEIREGGVDVSRPLRPTAPSGRLVLLVVEIDTAPCRQALEAIADLLPMHPDAEFVVFAPSASDESLAGFLSTLPAFRSALPGYAGATPLPQPLDGIAAFPTTIVIDGEGVIEAAVVGARTKDDWSRLLGGARSAEAADGELGQFEATPD